MLRSFFRHRKKKTQTPQPKYGWFGEFNDWKAVSAICGGYQQSNILEKTKNSLLKIRDGEAVYERDSVLFDQKIYPFQVISCLLHIAAKRQGNLCVIDFGGSLGSTYFQVRDFLSPLQLSWNIVEQGTYVNEGRKHFENDQLKFYDHISEVINKKRPDVILLSGVVQYLENPHQFFTELNTYDIEHILFDRTAFINEGNDRLTIQHVPPEIYDASYPAWFFNEAQFMQHFKSYRILAEFNSYVPGEEVLYIDEQPLAYDRGFLMEKRASITEQV